MIRAGLIGLLVSLPGFGFADPIVLPDGCAAYVTVQYSSCLVAHHYTCEGDIEGDQWRIDIDAEGPIYMGRIDRESQWMESIDVVLGLRDLLDPNPKEPASFTELAQTGRDDFHFSTTSDAGETITYQGRDLLTGRTVVIDDVPLLETETFARATDADGNLLWESTGNEYINLDWRVFLSGNYVTRTPQETSQSESRPIDFHLPGDDGFLTDTPKYNCNATIL